MLQERVSLHVVLCAAGDGSYRASKSDRAIVVTGRNPGIRFRLGTSLGSWYAFIAAAHDPCIRVAAFNQAFA